jgi:hypothetical protein
MYTPINKFKLTAEGKRIFEYYEKIIKTSFYSQGSPKKIYVTQKQFNLLIEGLSAGERKYFKNSLPFMGHTLIVSGK